MVNAEVPSGGRLSVEEGEKGKEDDGGDHCARGGREGIAEDGEMNYN